MFVASQVAAESAADERQHAVEIDVVNLAETGQSGLREF